MELEVRSEVLEVVVVGQLVGDVLMGIGMRIKRMLKTKTIYTCSSNTLVCSVEGILDLVTMVDVDINVEPSGST